MSAWRGTEGAFPAHAAASHKTNVSFWDAEEGKQGWGVRVVQTGTSTPCSTHMPIPWIILPREVFLLPGVGGGAAAVPLVTGMAESCKEHIHNKVSLMLASDASAAWNLSTVGYFFL